MPEGNPAARLHHVIETFFEQSNGTRLSWVLRLSAEPDDEDARKSIPDADVLRMFGGVVALPSQIRTILGQLPPNDEDVDHLADPLDHVEQALATLGPDGTLQKYRQVINHTDRSNLRHLKKALARNGWRERPADTDRLAQIRKDVADLFDDVQAADIDDDLRRFALRHLEKIEAGIRHYQVEGVPPIDDALDQFVGDIVRDAGEDDRRGIRRFVRDDALGRRLMRLVGEVNGAVHLATWAIEAAAGIPVPPAG